MAKKSKLPAGLSTGIEIHQYARSILKQALSLSDETLQNESPQSNEHFGVKPMLLALAMEFSLKAWFVFDHRLTPEQVHDLEKLFDNLKDSTKQRLNSEFQKTVVPLLPSVSLMSNNMSDILSHHANAFRDWRYIYERDSKKALLFETSLFVATLELFLDEFEKLYVKKEIK